MGKSKDLAELGSSATRLGTVGSNVVINGAMNVAQRATSATGVGSGFAYPTIDRYKIVPSTSGRATMTQTADGPAGFANCLKLECTTADTSIAATEYFILRQSFEGQDLQHFKKGTSSAEKIVVSFYVKGNAAATYTCELDDADNTRHNSQEFSVTTDWTRVILTFDGDTTGAFDDDNARSLNLDFWLHAGSNYTGGTHTDNVWHTTTNQRVGDNQTSFFDSTSRTFFITGIQMEAKRVTDFEHEPVGVTLNKCERYFQTYSKRVWTAINEHAANYFMYCNGVFRQKMRAAPTASFIGTVIIATPQVGVSQRPNVINNISTEGFQGFKWPTSGTYGGQLGTYGDSKYYMAVGDGPTNRIDFDAEL